MADSRHYRGRVDSARRRRPWLARETIGGKSAAAATRHAVSVSDGLSLIKVPGPLRLQYDLKRTETLIIKGCEGSPDEAAPHA